jgi:hypothetical protein
MAHSISFRIVLPAVLLLPLLSGCGDTDVSRTFGIVRDAPDEFQVTTRAPLSQPPDYRLRPPRPGAARPQEQSSRAAAEAALVPQASLGGDSVSTPGQQALLSAAGAPAPADIRQKVERDAALDSPGKSFTDTLMFWREPAQPGITVDPSKETQRLRANAALGQPVLDGDTPIIQPKRKGFFDKIF